MKELLTIAAIAAVLLTIVGCVIWKHRAIEADQRRALDTTLNPWLQHIQRGDFEHAWNTYTTPEYQRAFPLHDLQAAWQQRTQELGPLTAWELAKATQTTEPGKGTYHRLSFNASFQNGKRTLTWDLTERDGTFKLLDAFTHSPGGTLERNPL